MSALLIVGFVWGAQISQVWEFPLIRLMGQTRRTFTVKSIAAAVLNIKSVGGGG